VNRDVRNSDCLTFLFEPAEGHEANHAKTKGLQHRPSTQHAVVSIPWQGYPDDRHWLHSWGQVKS